MTEYEKIVNLIKITNQRIDNLNKGFLDFVALVGKYAEEGGKLPKKEISTAPELIDELKIN